MLYSSDKNQIKGTIRIIRRYLTQGKENYEMNLVLLISHKQVIVTNNA